MARVSQVQASRVHEIMPRAYEDNADAAVRATHA
jgi:hypothetical protein